jgi:UDP-glucuronate 4-epimerase
MKVFITGLAGFIGFHTAIKFHNEGWEVYGCDNFNELIYDPELKYDRAEELRLEYGINVPNIDISWQNEAVRRELSAIKPDLVIHLAAYPGVRVSMDHPDEYIVNNIIATQNLINIIQEVKIENVIYASTSCVMHGNPLPWKEYDKLGPHLSPYGYTKATNESQFHVSKIKNAVGLRFFTVYGPWGRPDMALFTFTKNILEGTPIEVNNNGDMKRDFTYVDDIVQGIWIVGNNMTERDIYCIGNGRQVDLMDFITVIEKELGLEATKEFMPRHPADAKETWSDTTKLQALGYKPTVSVEEGVKNFIQWYRNYYGSNT